MVKATVVKSKSEFHFICIYKYTIFIDRYSIYYRYSHNISHTFISLICDLENKMENLNLYLSFYIQVYILAWSCNFPESLLVTKSLASGNRYWLSSQRLRQPCSGVSPTQREQKQWVWKAKSKHLNFVSFSMFLFERGMRKKAHENFDQFKMFLTSSVLLNCTPHLVGGAAWWLSG